jgi:transcriptional regulator with XRE-family HTH domain
MYNMSIMMRKKILEQPITNVERLAADLRKLRRGRKVSQQELADRAKVARRTITNAESTENVGVKEYCRIANALGYDLVLRPKGTVVFEELSDTFKDDE